MSLPLLNARYYSQGTEPDLSFRYGLIMLWSATVVGVVASILAVAGTMTPAERRR